MKKYLGLALIALLVISCVATPEVITECLASEPAGFWKGLWHGLISPVTIVASFFMDNVSMYEVNNTGIWYDLGFIFGIGGLSSRA